MQFDHYTITMLILRTDAPALDDDEINNLQDEHMAHLADLHDAGHLLAAGPLLGAPDRTFRGLSIWRGTVEEVRGFCEAHPDPAVAAGRFRVELMPWMVPAGAMQFAVTRFPRSIADVDS